MTHWIRSSPRDTSIVVALIALTWAALACKVSDPLTQTFVERKPVTQQRLYSFPPGLLDKVAVLPFFADFPASLERHQRSVVPIEVADQIASQVNDALLRAGIDTIAPTESNEAFLAMGFEAPRRDPISAADLSAKEFGATAVLLGTVTRYRERGGGIGSSVAFELSLYTAPDGRKAWVATFDETQLALSQNLVNAGRYPGAGSRWLTAAELSRWGADSAIEALPQRR